MPVQGHDRVLGDALPRTGRYTFLQPGNTFNGLACSTLRTWVSEEAGGWHFVVTGIGRIVAGLVNSHRNATPVLRRGGGTTGGGFWLSAALALSPKTTGRPRRPSYRGFQTLPYL
jgi:hypothetical protein